MALRITTIAEIAPYAHSFGGMITARMQDLGRTLGSQTIGMTIQAVAPGHRSSRRHRHLFQEEILIVMSGTGNLLHGDSRIAVGPGACLNYRPDDPEPASTASASRCRRAKLSRVAGPRIGTSGDSHLARELWFETLVPTPVLIDTRLVRLPSHDSPISRSRQIFRARKSLISRWRGTVETFCFAGFRYTLWRAPSRSSTQPCRSRCRMSSSRFMPPIDETARE